MLKPRYITPFPQRVETRVTSTHFHNGLKPIAHKSVMATPFVRGMTFTSRVATADINSLTFQRRAEIPKSLMAMSFARGSGPTGEGGNPAYPNCFSIPLNPPFRPLSLFEYFPQKGKEKESLFIGEACVLSCLLQIIRYVAITKSSPGVYPARREGS